MDNRAKKLLNWLKGKRVGVFCDDPNLYYAYKKYKWRIDFAKFKNLLVRYCDLEFINYYVAIPDRFDADFKRVESFLKHISSSVVVKKKPLKYIPVKNWFVRKGDVDIEITLDVVRTIDDLDVVMIMSGDSDYYALKD